MSKKQKYTYEIVSTSHGDAFIVTNSKGVGICEAVSESMARKIARALNAMEAKPKAKPFKFDWSGIDPECRFAAMDSNGVWWGFSNRPEVVEKKRIWMDLRHFTIHVLHRYKVPPYPGDWRDSLQKRP